MPSYLSPGVYVEEVASGSRPIEGVGTSVAAFVGLAPTGPLNEPTLVTNWSQYVASFGEFTDGYFLAHSVYGFFNNGGSAAYVVRVGGVPGGVSGGAGQGSAAVKGGAAPAALPAGEPQQLGTFKVAALGGDRSGGGISVEVADAEGEGPADRFRLVVKEGDKVAETFDVTAKKGNRNYVVTQVKERSKLIVVQEAAAASQLARPDNQTIALAVPSAPPAVPSHAETDQPGVGDYVGDVADRTGFGGLEAIDEVTMVAVPDLMAAYQHGRHRPGDRQGGAARHDRPLRADGRPGRDPGPAARASTRSRS